MTTESKHHCDTCNKSFRNKRTLDNHYTTKLHNDRLDNIDSFLSCACNKSFKYKQGLYRHRKTCPVAIKNTKKKNEVQSVKNEITNKNAIIQGLKNEITNKNAIIRELKTQFKTLETTNKQLLRQITEENDTQHVVVKHGRQKIPLKTRELIRNKQENKCKQCTHELTPYFHLDHEVAMRFGGNHDIDNLQALCAECHTRKSTLESKYNMRIKAAIKDILNSHEV